MSQNGQTHLKNLAFAARFFKCLTILGHCIKRLKLKMLLQLKNKLQKNSENTVTIKETNKNSRW